MQQLTELQEKWLKALESGRYKQSKHFLKRDGGYCCLGVACRITGKKFNRKGLCEGMEGVVPDSVKKELRLRSSEGHGTQYFEIDGCQFVALASANDHGASFRQIAALVRANPENFFLPPEAP